MMEILTLVARAGDGLDLSGIAQGAPGAVGLPHPLGGASWSVYEQDVAMSTPSDLRELNAWLQDLTARSPVDWSRLGHTPARRKRLLISDMDSTIIGQECLDELADFAGLKAEVSAITERAMRGELNFEAALTTRVAMLHGLDLSALEACYAERVTLNPGARTLVATMKAHGARCVLVSGGFSFFTSRVAAACGFDADRANTLIDDGATLTGEVGQPILGREAKLVALNEETAAIGAAPADAIAMGDGANDLAMIKAAGLGVAYKAKPIVAAETQARIEHTDLTAALFFQGYREDEIVAG
jgi:phosphoserine phosphatase